MAYTVLLLLLIKGVFFFAIHFVSSDRMTLAGNVTALKEIRDTRKLLLGESEEEKPLAI